MRTACSGTAASSPVIVRVLVSSTQRINSSYCQAASVRGRAFDWRINGGMRIELAMAIFEALDLEWRAHDFGHPIAAGEGILGDKCHDVLDVRQRSMPHAGVLAERQGIVGRRGWQTIDLRAQRIAPPHRSVGRRPGTLIDVDGLQLGVR